MQNGSIIFLKTVLILLIGVISKPLTAQMDTQKADKLEKSASEGALEESDTPYTSMLAPTPQKVQNLPLIVANTAIRYKNSATVYLYLNHVELATAFYMESPTVGKRIYVDMPPTGEVVLKGVPKETDFSLFAIVGDSTYKIASVTTKPDALGSITVSNMLYEEVVKWQIMKPRPALFDHIQSSKDVNVYEKTAFLQQFYMADKDLAEESPDGSVSMNDLGGGSSFALLGECKCKLLFNYAQLPIPYNGVSASSGSLNTTNWGSSTAWSNISGMNVLQFGNSAGANKYTQFQTNGKRLSGREISFNAVEVGSTQTAAFLDYSLVCENAEDPGVDCGCAKNVDIMYQFDAHLRTDGALTQCFLCGSKASHSLIEEMVALTILNHRDKSAIVVDAKRAEAKTEVNRTVNSNFLVSALQLAGEVGKLFLPNAGTINGTAVDKINTALQALIKEPMTTGGGASSVFRANMVDSRYFFKIFPNQPIRVALTSLTKANLGGSTAWQNKAESNTDFALAGVVTIPRVEDRADPNCCSPKIANWVLGGFEGSVVNQANLRQKVGVFLNAFAPWKYLTNDLFTNAIVIPKDMGSTEHSICSKSGIIVGPLDPQLLKGRTTAGTTWTVAQKDNVMLIQNAQNKEPFNYTIWDGLGRLILSGKSASEVTQTTFELPDISSGMYLLRVEQDKNTYTSKFTKF